MISNKIKKQHVRVILLFTSHKNVKDYISEENFKKRKKRSIQVYKQVSTGKS